MAYKVIFNAHAARSFRKLSADVQKKLKPAIEGLCDDPRPPGAEKLTGAKDTYHIRVSMYRVLYEIQDDLLLVVIVETAHRREVHRRG